VVAAAVAVALKRQPAALLASTLAPSWPQHAAAQQQELCPPLHALLQQARQVAASAAAGLQVASVELQDALSSAAEVATRAGAVVCAEERLPRSAPWVHPQQCEQYL